MVSWSLHWRGATSMPQPQGGAEGWACNLPVLQSPPKQTLPEVLAAISELGKVIVTLTPSSVKFPKVVFEASLLTRMSCKFTLIET